MRCREVCFSCAWLFFVDVKMLHGFGLISCSLCSYNQAKKAAAILQDFLLKVSHQLWRVLHLLMLKTSMAVNKRRGCDPSWLQVVKRLFPSCVWKRDRNIDAFLRSIYILHSTFTVPSVPNPITPHTPFFRIMCSLVQHAIHFQGYTHHTKICRIFRTIQPRWVVARVKKYRKIKWGYSQYLSKLFSFKM